MEMPFAARDEGTGGLDGARARVVPFGAATIAILFVVVLVYPIMKLSPHDVPAAVLNLDAGARSGGERINAGDTLLKRLTGEEDDGGSDSGLASALSGSSEGEDDSDNAGNTLSGDVISWTTFDDRASLDAAMTSGGYYLAIVIPSDFSKRMIAWKKQELLGELLSPAADSPVIEVVINQGRNPMVTNSVEPSLSAFEALGIEVEKSYVVELPEEMQRGFSHMPLMIMTYLTSYIAGAVIGMTLSPPRRGRREAARGLLGQTGTSLAVAAFVGVAGALVYQAMLGIGVDWVQLALLMGLSSFALQMVVVGFLDLLGTAGMAVPMLLMAFCMTSAYLPYEFLPSFWQDFIYPWNPLRHMVDAYKAVIYLGQGFWNNATPALFAVLAIGLAVMAANLLKNPQHEPRTLAEEG